MDAEGVIATPTVVGVAIACALLVGAYVAIFLPLFLAGERWPAVRCPDFRELNGSRRSQKDREVKVRARGLSPSPSCFSSLHPGDFRGVRREGGPTSLGRMFGVTRRQPRRTVERSENSAVRSEYKSDGAYIQNGRPRGTYRVEGNRLIYNGLRPEETFNYFAVTGGIF